jgi:hypothetical protein
VIEFSTASFLGSGSKIKLLVQLLGAALT